MDTLEESSYFKMIVKDAISDLKHKRYKYKSIL